MKAIIFCNGTPKELLPITYTIPKELLPIANKPLIIYTIEFLLNAGIGDIGIVTNGNSQLLFRKIIKKYFLNDFYYIIQDDLHKTNYITSLIKEFIKDEDFLMILGNNSFKFNLKDVLIDFQKSKCHCKILLKKVRYPEFYNVAYISGNKILELEKKPKVSFSDLAITGMYIFNNDSLKAFKEHIDTIDFIKFLLYNEYNVSYEILNGYWREIRTPLDILEENIHRLNSIAEYMKGEIVNSHISGKVILEEGVVVYNSTIRGPVIVDENSIIKNSYIGPYTTIGKTVSIEQSNVENSIILNGCSISEVKDTIDSSIIGEKSIIKGENVLKRTNRLIVGRNSKVFLKK